MSTRCKACNAELQDTPKPTPISDETIQAVLEHITGTKNGTN